MTRQAKFSLNLFGRIPYYHIFCDRKSKQSFRNALGRLKNKGLVVGERRNGKVIFNLSDKGEILAKRLKLKLELAKKRHWDGKWRILIFDVPEKIRGKRDFLRRKLVDFGFYPLQKSVWVYPYNLPKDFFDIFSELDFGEQLVLVESTHIKQDNSIRAFFALA